MVFGHSTGFNVTVEASKTGSERIGDFAIFFGERDRERRRFVPPAGDRLRFLSFGDLTLVLYGDFDFDFLGDRDLRLEYFL